MELLLLVLKLYQLALRIILYQWGLIVRVGHRQEHQQLLFYQQDLLCWGVGRLRRLLLHNQVFQQVQHILCQ